MDKYIEILSYLMSEENILYSLGLLVILFFIFEFIIFMWSKNNTDAIKYQLMQEQKDLDITAHKNEELLILQKNDEKHIENLQLKLRESTQGLMDVEKKLIAIEIKEGHFEKLFLEKQAELKEQKSQISEQSINQQKIEEIEQEAIQLAKDLSVAKQQLRQQEIEINKNNKQIEALDNTSIPLDKGDEGKVDELETTIEQNDQLKDQLLTEPENNVEQHFTVLENEVESESESESEPEPEPEPVAVAEMESDSDSETENTSSISADDLSVEEKVVEQNVDHFQAKLKSLFRKLVS